MAAQEQGSGLFLARVILIGLCLNKWQKPLSINTRKNLLLFCPAEHYIPDLSKFQTTIETGVEAAQNGAIVTFGIVPSFPRAAYGYIQKGVSSPDGSFRVKRLFEKQIKIKLRNCYWLATFCGTRAYSWHLLQL